MDIALLLGDIVCQYKPSCTWNIDFTIKNPDASDAFHRPALRGMAIPDNPVVAPIMILSFVYSLRLKTSLRGLYLRYMD